MILQKFFNKQGYMAAVVSPIRGSLRTLAELAAERRSSLPITPDTGKNVVAHYVVKPEIQRSHSLVPAPKEPERPSLPRARSVSDSDSRHSYEVVNRMETTCEEMSRMCQMVYLIAIRRVDPIRLGIRPPEKKALAIYDLKELPGLKSEYCIIDDTFKSQMRKDWSILERVRVAHRQIIFALKHLTRLPENALSVFHESFSFNFFTAYLNCKPQQILVERFEEEVLDAIDDKKQTFGYKITNPISNLSVKIWGNPRGDVTGSFKHIAWYGHYGKAGTPTRVDPAILLSILTGFSYKSND